MIWTTLFQYTIKTNGKKTVLVEKGNERPIQTTNQGCETSPMITVAMLEGLAAWAKDQADAIRKQTAAQESAKHSRKP